MSMKNFNDTIGNRTRELPTCSAVPQPNVPPRTPESCKGTHPSASWKGTGGSFPGVKRPGHEVGHSPPPSAEAKNEWSWTSNAPICLQGVQRDAFNFLYSFKDRRHHCKVGHQIRTAYTSITSRVSLLDAFVKLKNATISFAMSVCLSVRLHGTTRLPLDGY